MMVINIFFDIFSFHNFLYNKCFISGDEFVNILCEENL